MVSMSYMVCIDVRCNVALMAWSTGRIRMSKESCSSANKSVGPGDGNAGSSEPRSLSSALMPLLFSCAKQNIGYCCLYPSFPLPSSFLNAHAAYASAIFPFDGRLNHQIKHQIKNRNTICQPFAVQSSSWTPTNGNILRAFLDDEMSDLHIFLFKMTHEKRRKI